MGFTLYTIIREDKPNSKGFCPLYLRYTYNRKYYNIPTDLTLKIEDWNKEDRVIRRRFSDRDNYNLIISKIEGEVKTLITDFKITNDRFPDVNELKEIITSGYNKKKGLESYFEDFVRFKKEIKNSEPSTIVVYNTTWKRWKKYEELIGKVHQVKDMTLPTFEGFRSYCEREGLQYNTIGKYIKTFKTFLHYLSSHHKIPIPPDFSQVHTLRNETDFEVLTHKELETLKSAIYESKFEGRKDYGLTEHEKLVGSMMVFMCSTGLSFTDFNKITIDDIIFENADYTNEGGCFIKLTRTKLKSKDLCVIPILDGTINLILDRLGIFDSDFIKFTPLPLKQKVEMLKSLITGYGKNTKLKSDFPRLFPVMANQVFNRVIKDVCKKIELEEKVKVVKKINNKIVEMSVPKYEMITSHTGRRTYITLCLEQGIRLDYLMSTTGHKKLDTMKKYTKIPHKRVGMEFVEKVKEKPQQEPIIKPTPTLNELINKLQKNRKEL